MSVLRLDLALPLTQRLTAQHLWNKNIPEIFFPLYYEYSSAGMQLSVKRLRYTCPAGVRKCYVHQIFPSGSLSLLFGEEWKQSGLWDENTSHMRAYRAVNILQVCLLAVHSDRLVFHTNLWVYLYILHVKFYTYVKFLLCPDTDSERFRSLSLSLCLYICMCVCVCVCVCIYIYIYIYMRAG